MVKVEALGLRGMITLRCDMSTVGAVAEIAVPAVGQMTTVGDRVLAWMSPDEDAVVAACRSGCNIG